MSDFGLNSRNYQESLIRSAMQAQSAKGSLYRLIYNFLNQPEIHRRAGVLRLCQQQGYSKGQTIDALRVLEMAGWIHNTTDRLEVLVFLTEYAKLRGGAEL